MLLPTVPTEQNQTSNPVVTNDKDPDLATCSEAETNSKSHDSVNGSVVVNHPRLRTKLKLSRLKISFLKRCRKLKRPPVTLRVKMSKLINLKTQILIASNAESTLLEESIREKKKEIDEIRRCIKLSTIKLLEINEREAQNLQAVLDKKFVWLQHQDKEKWGD